MSKNTAHKQPRAGGKFCRIPDGYVSDEQQSKVLGELHTEYKKQGHLKYYEGHSDGFKVGYNSAYDDGKESGMCWGVLFGAVGMFVAGLAMMYLMR